MRVLLRGTPAMLIADCMPRGMIDRGEMMQRTIIIRVLPVKIRRRPLDRGQRIPSRRMLRWPKSA
jgi:hypothetical protein